MAVDKLKPDQIEVSIFGPGFGECILVHLGGGAWVVIDSCINPRTQNPIALDYLDGLGFPRSSVKLILATHWHDDHVRGLSNILSGCPRALFATSSAMAAKDFAKMIAARKSIRLTTVTSGVDEIDEVYRLLKTSKRDAMQAVPNRLLFRLDGGAAGHGFDCSVTSLSPSDRQMQIFQNDISEMMPKLTESEGRLVARNQNHTAVTCWISIGHVSMLMGSDLQETADPGTGWSIIVRDPNRPTGKADVFKIPHHGSHNGHCDGVWDEMLVPNPISILTPYIGGHNKLPTPNDINRITSLSDRSFATSGHETAKSRTRHLPAVDRTLRESGISIRVSNTAMGHVRIRNGGTNAFFDWNIQLDQNARLLRDFNRAA